MFQHYDLHEQPSSSEFANFFLEEVEPENLK